MATMLTDDDPRRHEAARLLLALIAKGCCFALGRRRRVIHVRPASRVMPDERQRLTALRAEVWTLLQPHARRRRHDGPTVH